MYKVAICDNDEGQHHLIENLLQRLSVATPYLFHIQHFFSGRELYNYYLEDNNFPFHFLIVDIELKEINGIEIARKIRDLQDHSVQILFMTSHPEALLGSFDVQPFHYLLKPMSYELFKCKIIMLCKYINSLNSQFLLLKTEDDYIVLNKKDVIAIVKIKHTLAKNKLTVISSDQHYTVTGTLTELLNRLEYPFFLIHRSTIINLEHICRFTNGFALMSNQIQYPIGRTQARKIKDAFTRYTLTQL